MLPTSRPSLAAAASALFLGASLPNLVLADAWRQAYEGWAAPHGLTGLDASLDADGDGLTNFQEFALGTSPTEKTRAHDYQRLALVRQGAQVWPEFTYRRHREALDHGVRFEIQRSDDLVHWREAQPLTFLTGKTEVSTDGLSELVTLRLEEDFATQQNLFFRLRIGGLETRAGVALEAVWPQILPLEELDGTVGFTIRGAREDDILGASVSNLGDVNGDGFDDVITGARGAGDNRNGNFSGEAYVVFGSANPPAIIGVETLNGTNGFTILGARRDDRLGTVSAAGDVNGDGLADIFVGAHLADLPEKNAGAGYVIFGRTTGFPALLDVSSLNGTNGFTLRGASKWDRTGVALADAGDLNDDGFGDVVIGADLADPADSRSGKAYVVFGRGTGFPAEIDLGALDGTNGFTLLGPGLDKFAGRDVANAGDVNGDGVNDLLVGTGDRRQRSDDRTDQTFYVLFGNREGFPARQELERLDGTDGFRFRITIRANEYAGGQVAGNGDWNGDGIADIAIANEEGGVKPQAAGTIYVVFGRADGFPPLLHDHELDGVNGTLFQGIEKDDNAGSDIDFVGDVNGDGRDDLLIGALRGNGLSSDEDFSDSGEAYLIFGQETSPARQLIADLLNTPAAVFFPGIEDDDLTGKAVSRAGDVNGDGLPDFIIGSHRANRDTDGDGRSEESNSGEAYVIFGRLVPQGNVE